MRSFTIIAITVAFIFRLKFMLDRRALDKSYPDLSTRISPGRIPERLLPS